MPAELPKFSTNAGNELGENNKRYDMKELSVGIGFGRSLKGKNLTVKSQIQLFWIPITPTIIKVHMGLKPSSDIHMIPPRLLSHTGVGLG